VGKLFRALILVAALVAVGVFAGSALSQWWSVPGSGEAAEVIGSVVRPRERVRVEVLNAGGRQNMARDATEALRDDGFDVVFFGNGRAFSPDTSVVLDRVGRIELARQVADALGIREVRSQPDSNLFLDVSVVLGKEWDLPAPVVPVELPRPWWDVRRFLPKEDSAGAPQPAEPRGEPSGTLVDPAQGGDR
jgi:hypothetical protein